MALAPGTKLGPYEIQALLGAGGMGEVYRARDTRLERAVAIKILPADLSSDPIRKQRFEREAKTISGLNHPNICVLYDVGHQDGVDYLVMECLEGETLAKRLEKGALPLEQVLKYGAQIADALAKAHRSGIVHRDLKPGNIMLTSTGAKLLDFGLAKPAAPLVSGATLTTGAAETTPVTQEGTIVGTFCYMSPEQIEGKELDERSDIFSFGTVLYEIVTGKRAFEGTGRLSLASAILEKEPTPISSIKPMTPPALDFAIRKCLAKLPDERWQNAGDLASQLKWIAESSSQVGMPALAVSHRKLGERLILASVAVLAITTVLVLWRLGRPLPKEAQPVRLSAEIGTEAKLYTGFGASTILSPDGTRLAFLATGSDQKRRIYVRSLDQLQAFALSGTEDASTLFFSPDGQWLGFFADGKLKKIEVLGGTAVSICDAPYAFGGSWAEDGTIVFAGELRTPLSQVSSAGGTLQPLMTLDQQAKEITQRWPQLLPGGKSVLFTSNSHGGGYEDADIVAYSMLSGQRRTVLHGGFHARYVPTGHVVYMHEGTLFAVPFDLKHLKVTGQPSPILGGVLAVPFDGSAQFSVSDGGNGNLAYVAGHSAFHVSVYWMDRQGKFTPLRETPGFYLGPAFSPDGKRLALQIYDGKRNDIWVYEWERDALTRLTFGSGDNYWDPIWTPDGQRITYAAYDETAGVGDLYWKRADGTGEAQRLTETKTRKWASSWSPDGKVLAFDQLKSGPGVDSDTLTMTIEGSEKLGWKPGKPKLFLSGPFTQNLAAFSPDGRWLAYTSNESGTYEVYVRPLPGPGGKWQISAGGGSMPKWSRNSKELLYRNEDNRIMTAAYTVSGDVFRPEKPQLWSPEQFTDLGGSINEFDLHPDGKRVVVLRTSATGETSPANKVNFIFNFFDELRRKVPAGKK